jgi:uncharacterized protein (TIGR02246 family)
MARSKEQLVRNHMAALTSGNLAALTTNFSENAVLMTVDGVREGKDAIQEWFRSTLTGNPNIKMTSITYKVHGDGILVNWAAESDQATRQGVDYFAIRDDLIQVLAIWFSSTPK